MPKAKPFPDAPDSADSTDSEEEEKTTIESQWEDEASTTVEQGDAADKIREIGAQAARRPQQTGTHTGAADELTVDDQQAQSAITPVRDVARLTITQGNDAGQEVEIRPGKTYTIGRAIDNDIVLTDIAVSRKHFDLRFEDGAWVIVDRGSGNGTVVNGNLEDNPFMLANGDVIEIGNTVFRFEQPNAAPRPQRGMDVDDEEFSTVAGKPMRDVVEDKPAAAVAPRPARPKTMPPPAPLRAATAAPPPLAFSPPPVAAPVLPSPVPLPPQPSSTLPLPQMANRAPLGSAPVMLGEQLAVPQSNAPSTTLPGSAPQPARTLYTYPQATEIPPHSVHAQMMLIQTQNRRSDGSTALVSPTPYDAMPVGSSPRYLAPQLTKRAKLVLAGIGLAVLAAVLTVAITKSGSSTTPVAENDELDPTAATSAAAKPTTPSTNDHEEAGATGGVTVPEPAIAEPGIAAPGAPVKAEPPKIDARPEPASGEPPKPEPAKITKTESPRVTKPEAKQQQQKARDRREVRRDPEATTPTSPPTTTSTTKRVAALDPEQAKDQADSLYRAKKFSEASNVLASAAKKVDEEDARELRRTAEMYARLGRALAQGTAPATKATEAFEALRQAQNYDRNVGNAFDTEIQGKLAQVAPKAALSYMAAKNYPQARSAVLAAQQFGASESVKIVSQKLESVAGDLYNEGMRELDSNPSAAKDKFRQIKTIVDAKSTWYQKAQKQLQGG